MKSPSLPYRPAGQDREAGDAVRRTNHSGFTLIEIVIALAILVLMVGISYSALNGILQTQEYLEEVREAQALANSVIVRVTRELQLADPNAALLPPREDPDQRYPRNINLVGTSEKQSNGQSADRISFMARGAGQYVLGSSSYSNLVKITYRVEENPNKQPGQDTLVLVREETPAIRPIEKAFERTMVFPLTDRLIGLSFDYYDFENDRWQPTWGSSETPGLPSMIQFSMRLRSRQGVERTYTTSVPLRGTADGS